MDETTSFIEHFLDRRLYTPKKFYSELIKKPLRVLICDAGSRVAYNLIYQICSGNVFGKNQEIILHLQNSKEPFHHKAIALELVECGFPCLKDVVLSSDPAVAFKNVDFAIVIASFEELSGLEISGTILHQAIKSVTSVKNIEEYASENCKIIFTGPVTKTATILLGVLPILVPNLLPENISCVTCLDAIISKAVLGKKLRTTTDRIKNVIIWSNTYPDVSNATVLMYPPDDLGLWEKKDISVVDAVQDDEWIYKTFAPAINKRIIHNDLMSYGKAIAMATAQHLKVIYEGSQSVDEIHSMGVLTPSTEPYGVPMSYGFSYPVFVENGKWEVLKDIKVGIPTKINILNACSKTLEWEITKRLVKYLKLMDSTESLHQHIHLLDLNGNNCNLLKINRWDAKYFVTPNPAESIEKSMKPEGRKSRKSIVWDDTGYVAKALKLNMKSLIRFSSDSVKGSNTDF